MNRVKGRTRAQRRSLMGWAGALTGVLVALLLCIYSIAAEGELVETFEPVPPVTVAVGTAAGEVPLPDEVTAVVLSAQEVEDEEGNVQTAYIPESHSVPVSWSSTDYDGETPGTYTFSAAVGSGYKYSEAPNVHVTVEGVVPPETDDGDAGGEPGDGIDDADGDGAESDDPKNDDMLGADNPMIQPAAGTMTNAYVNYGAASNGDGSQANPFNNMQDAIDAVIDDPSSVIWFSGTIPAGRTEVWKTKATIRQRLSTTSPLVTVSAGASLSIEGATFDGKYINSSGALSSDLNVPLIIAYGSIKFVDCTITGLKSTYASSQVGRFLTAYGTASKPIEVEFDGCTMTGTTGQSAVGAAIGMIVVVNANVTIKNSTFTNNAPGWAGGVIGLNDCNVVVEDSIFDSNSTTLYGAASCITWSTSNQKQEIHINNTTFNNNVVSARGTDLEMDQGMYQAGAVRVSYYTSNRYQNPLHLLYINDCTFSANRASFTSTVPNIYDNDLYPGLALMHTEQVKNTTYSRNDHVYNRVDVNIYGQTETQLNSSLIVVTYHMNNGTGQTQNQIVRNGGTATNWTPIWGKNTFQGWYTDENCTTAYNFATLLYANRDLYAKWTLYSAKVEIDYGYPDSGGVWQAFSPPVTRSYPSINSGTVIDLEDVSLPTGYEIVYYTLASESHAIKYTDTNFTVEDNDTVRVWCRIPYTVTYYLELGGTTPYDTERVYDGDTATAATPTWGSKQFLGWYYSDGTTQYTGQAITGDTALYAKWNVAEISVEFYYVSTDGTYITPSAITDTATVDVGETYSLPLDKMMSAYAYKYYTVDTDPTQNTGTSYTPVSGGSVTLKVYGRLPVVIQFHLNDGSGTIYEIHGSDNNRYAIGDLLDRPTPDPTYTGDTSMEFVAWYKDTGSSQLFDFASDRVTGNTDLHAGWRQMLLELTVNFVEGDGDSWTDFSPAVTDTASIPVGQTYTIPVDTKTPSGYTALYYTLGSESHSVRHMVSDGAALTATAEGTDDVRVHCYIPYTVTYYYNRGDDTEVYETETVYHGYTAVKPTDPTWSANIFQQWHTDKDTASEYAFTTPVRSNLDLYAHWEITDVEITLIYYAWDETTKTWEQFTTQPVPGGVSHPVGSVLTLKIGSFDPPYATYYGYFYTVNDDTTRLLFDDEGTSYTATEEATLRIYCANAMMVVDVPANGFYWYANRSTMVDMNVSSEGYSIRSGEYTISNQSPVADIDISVVEYRQRSGGLDQIEQGNYDDDITLTLEGSQLTAEIQAVNLMENFPATELGKLRVLENMQYQFVGLYKPDSGMLPDQARSDYVMTLLFEARFSFTD